MRDIINQNQSAARSTLFTLQSEVRYMNRPAWIVSIRQPNLMRGERGRYYGLSSKPGSAKIDYNDVMEEHLSSPHIESITYVSGAYGAAMPVYHKPRLVK